MGLDSVELVMEFEKKIGIEIPDADAEKLTTVGLVHEYIYNRIISAKSNHCLSQYLFYKIRRYCSDNFGVSKSTINVKSNINEKFPKKNRKVEYKKFSEAIAITVPELTLSNKTRKLLEIIGSTLILGSLIIAFLLTSFFSYSKWFYMLPVAGIILTILISQLLNPYRTTISPMLVKDYIYKLISLNYAQLTENNHLTKQEIISVINQVIVDKIGVDMEELTPEKSFTDDLGVD